MFFSDKNRDIIINHLDLLGKFVNGEVNNIDIKPSINGSKMQIVEEKLLNIIANLKQQKQEDLRVFGEIMLVCEKLSDGYTDDRIVSTTSDKKINFIAKSINLMVEKIDSALKEVFKTLEKYDNGDFTERVREDFFRGGELKNLILSLNALSSNITNRTKISFDNGTAMERESSNLKQKSAYLFETSAKQVAAIEETASSVDDIKSLIVSNNESLMTIDKLNQELKSSTNKSMNHLENTKLSMENIDNSTQKVYEAITIISQIAFQTNILSLNAAVEAATAGEAGKGFAVVAQEVRNLATRSADAAKTIESMMNQLREETQKGRVTSENMSQEYYKLNDSITNTIELVNRIVVASREQLVGVDSINASMKNIENLSQKTTDVASEVSVIANSTYERAVKTLDSVKKIKF